MLITHVAITGVLLCLATEVLFLILFTTLVESNHLAVLSHSFDCSSATLIGLCPVGGDIFGASDLGQLVLVSIQSPELLHSFIYRICMERVGRVVRDLG
jgi:hypothetical protein